MFNSLSKKIVSYQFKKGVIEEKEKNVYEYAYNLLFSRIAVYVIMLVVGALLGNLKEIILFVIFFSPLRQYAGGYHLDKTWKCICASALLILLSGQYIRFFTFVYILHLFLWLVAVSVIIGFAPIDCSSKRLDQTERFVYKKRALIVLSLELVIATLCGLTHYTSITKAIFVVHTIVAINLVLGFVKNYFLKIKVSER